MKLFLLIHVKMPTIVGILKFISGKNSILGLSEPKKKAEFLDIFIPMNIQNFMLNWVEHDKSFITSGPGLPFGDWFAGLHFLYGYFRISCFWFSYAMAPTFLSWRVPACALPTSSNISFEILWNSPFHFRQNIFLFSIMGLPFGYVLEPVRHIFGIYVYLVPVCV